MNNLGCCFLENGINFDFNKVTDCCIMHNDGRGLPILIEDYNGEPIDWEKLFETKAKRIAEQKEKTIYDCEGCYHLGYYEFKNEKKISDFHFSQCRVCNATCVYCGYEYNSSKLNYSPYPIIQDLIEKGYYKAGGEATFQGGEPTIMPDFDELIALFLEHGTKIRVHSSGIKYSPTIADALKKNMGSIVISIDSSCKNTYKKIKKTDAFDKVYNNIKQYTEASSEHPENVIIKYIIVPGINDNLKEIDKFFKLMKELKINTVALDIEVQYAMKYENKNVSPHIYLLVDYFNKKAKEYNINLLTYSFLTYVLQNRTIETSKFLDNKFLYGFYVNMKKDTKKNLKYRG